MTEQEAIQAVRNNNKFPVWEYCDDKFGRFPLRVTAAPMRGRTEGVLICLPHIVCTSLLRLAPPLRRRCRRILCIACPTSTPFSWRNNSSRR